MCGWPLRKFFKLEKIFHKINCFFAHNWRLAVLDSKAGRWVISAHPSMIPYLKAENANGRHILVQPGLESFYMLADDLNWSTVQAHHTTGSGRWRPGRMVVETSPTNYQVWIRSSRELSPNEKRHWLKKMHSDPAATPENRWGRMPGFRNRKEKYQSDTGQYPLSRLIWVDWIKQAQIPVAKPAAKAHPFQPAVAKRRRTVDIGRSNYEKDNESITDFAYALALARRGYDANEIIKRILSERSDWTHHSGEKRQLAYLNRTVSKAIQIITTS